MSLDSSNIAPPTQRLPPIKSLRSWAVEPDEIQTAIDYLRSLYNPQVRGSSRRKKNTLPQDGDVGERHAEQALRADTDSALWFIRSDSFERSFAIRWLTTFISCASTQDHDGEWEQRDLDGLLQSAASLLAACSGAAASGNITRTFTFGPSPVGETIQILLNDAPLENRDYSSVGSQTWGGACVLAELIVEDPISFGIPEHSDKTTFRVLELGAGTGLVGLTVYKLLSARMVQTSLVLTDYYPSVLENLQGNAQANLLPNLPIDVARLDWETFPTMDASHIEGKLNDTFDLIVGADIVYEEDHAIWIKACLERLLHRPSTASLGAVFHLVIPLRATHTMESSTVEKVFALQHEDFSKFPDMALGILHYEQIICDAHATACDARFPDRADEVVYAHYKIGWVKEGHE